MSDIKNLTPNDVLRRIINDPHKDSPGRIYIILGKTGPTGKTWLWDKLTKHGLNAIEITESIDGLVTYNDDQNHYIEPIFGVTVVILNKRLSNLE